MLHSSAPASISAALVASSAQKKMVSPMRSEWTSIQVTPFAWSNVSKSALCVFSLNSGGHSRSGLNPSLPLSFALPRCGDQIQCGHSSPSVSSTATAADAFSGASPARMLLACWGLILLISACVKPRRRRSASICRVSITGMLAASW